MVRFPIGVGVPFVPVKRDVRARFSRPYVYRESERVFWLTYDKRARTGTGRFSSARKAMAWYNNGGR